MFNFRPLNRMCDDTGCSRNRIMSGGGSTVYSLGGQLIGHGLNNAYGLVGDAGCGSAARQMVSPGQPGLPGMSMSGGRRRRRRGRGRRTARKAKQHGGGYGFNLAPQMINQNYNPNQYASLVSMRGETCTPFNRGLSQMGGGAMLSPAPVSYPPTMTATPASYQAALEVGKSVYTNVIPPGQTGPNTYMLQQPLGAAQISASCLKTGGRRSRKGRKASRKSRRVTKRSK